MTRVGNTDQIMALVRSQLKRMTKRERSAGGDKVNQADSPRALSQNERIQALSAIEDLSDEEFARGLVRAFLSEEFGEAVSNSSGFQQIVERTAGVMQADPQISALLRQVREGL